MLTDFSQGHCPGPERDTSTRPHNLPDISSRTPVEHFPDCGHYSLTFRRAYFPSQLAHPSSPA